MEMIVMYLFGSLLIGIGYRIWIKWSSAKRLKKPVEWNLILMAAAGSLIANAILILYRNALMDILPVTYVTMLIYGYFGDSVFRGWLKKAKPVFNK